ncbi:phosphoribosylformylglycinamidine synthase subunit PurS [Thermosediminibacter oceani]|uniref:Phosphoribosylformylglycinamidine synthase subunit PurS n=1 Tax=Thermosediminibacter oceani (strain ATCC BAA-1034 / DSM 16646 / JW/IW-1228P) TaxID=555079 RepID=D9RY29_THEOJ|nr:phosphoribosylformylglycinamidine synthase subunit PurS [Thermosediminibacter oceani]ADL08253.1 phosphoribosylformylglycinamidine synthase, purS [Thermosediminibacter oceani DSM 16646]
MYLARIHVRFKPGVLDPQGAAILGALNHLGFEGVKSARTGKMIEITLEAEDRSAAGRTVREMCEKLLANPVIEDFTFEIAEENL